MKSLNSLLLLSIILGFFLCVQNFSSAASGSSSLQESSPFFPTASAFVGPSASKSGPSDFPSNPFPEKPSEPSVGIISPGPPNQSPSSNTLKKESVKKVLQIDFDLDYVVVGTHRIPTQEVFSNEICIFVAALYRREEMSKIPDKSLCNLEFYLSHIYRTTQNTALKRRIKQAVKFLVNFHKVSFDLENTSISEKNLPSVEKLADELCILIDILVRANELDQVNYKPLNRTLTYLHRLYPLIKEDLLKKRIIWAERYLKGELSKKKNLSQRAHLKDVGQLETLPLLTPNGTGTPENTPAAQKRLKRLATLAQQNLINPNSLPPSDQTNLNQMKPSGAPINPNFDINDNSLTSSINGEFRP